LIIGESVEHKVLPNPGLFIPTVSVELKTGKRGILGRVNRVFNPMIIVFNPHCRAWGQRAISVFPRSSCHTGELHDP